MANQRSMWPGGVRVTRFDNEMGPNGGLRRLVRAQIGNVACKPKAIYDFSKMSVFGNLEPPPSFRARQELLASSPNTSLGALGVEFFRFEVKKRIPVAQTCIVQYSSPNNEMVRPYRPRKGWDNFLHRRSIYEHGHLDKHEVCERCSQTTCFRKPTFWMAC